MAASSSFNYQKGSSLFSVEDDVDDAEFLRVGGRSNNTSSTLEERKQQLLHEKSKIEERTIQSSLRSISLLNESEDIGVATAKELAQQREQLQNTEQKLDEINSALRISQRHIQGIKSVFGSIKNYFSTPPKQLQSVREQKEDSSNLPASTDISQNDSPAPGYAYNSNSSPTTATSPPRRTQTTLPTDRNVDNILEDNLNVMGESLSRLKGLGLSLQTEIEDQNLLVERIIGKTDNADHRIEQQNQQMKKILKK